MLKFVASYFSPYKKRLTLVLVCSVLTAISELSTPYFTAKFIDEILVSKSYDTFCSFIALIAFVCILAILANYIYIVASTKVQFLLIRDMVQDITEHVQRLSVAFLGSMDMTYLSKRIEQDTRDLVSFVLGSIIDISIQIIILATTTSLLFTIDIFWVAIFIAIAFIHLVLYRLHKKALLDVSLLLREQEGRFFSALTDNYIYSYSIKLHSLYKEFIEKFRQKYNDYYVAGVRRLKVSFWFTNTRFNSGRIFSLFIFMIGGYQVLEGNMSIGNFVALNGYFIISMEGIYFFMNFGQGYQNALSAYSRITEIMNQPVANNGNLKLNSIRNISVENVSYYVDGKAILPKVSFSFQTGKVYCLTGRNGTGKSTLINLLLGMYEPTDGIIMYDGVNISQLDMIDARRRLISIAEQKDFIPYDRPNDNISLGYNINEEQKNGCIKGFSLCKALLENRSVIAENSLSGGEKKKIALVRALTQNTDLLILDEPDNNLDASSISFLISELKCAKKKRIVIIVSHEPQFMEFADEVIKLGMDKGA